MKKTLHIDEQLLREAKSAAGAKTDSNRAPYAGRLDELLGRDDVSGHDFVYGELLTGDRGGRMDQAPVGFLPH